MRLALMTEPQQGLTYDEIRAAAQTAEEAGLEAFFRSDHYAAFPGPEDGPTTDAWATLAGLARDTSRIHIGSLVSPMTFRLPGPFAKLVATVDEMSGGRVEVGMGAGWNDLEHAQLGIPFPDLDERYTMLEESVAIVHGLWTEPDGWRFDGAHWQVRDALFRTRPERNGRRHPPIILGGRGGPRLARLAAQLRRRVQPELRLARQGAGGVRPDRRGLPGDRARPRRDHAQRHDRRADRRHARGADRSAANAAGAHRRRGRRGGGVAGRAAGALDHGHPGRGGGADPRLRARRACSGSCCRTSSRATWT